MKVSSAVALAALMIASCRGPVDIAARSSAAPASARASLSPLDVVRLFHKTIKAGETAKARSLLAETRGGPDREQDVADIMDFAAMISGGSWDFEVVECKEDRSCAVVVINENVKQGRPAVDFDPFYLVKQDNAWRLLPNPCIYDRDYYGFSPGRLERFERLKQWFKQRKGELRRSIGR